MQGGDLLALWRREMNDEVEPYLWPDDDFTVYLDDAQQMFCRKTDGIADASSEATVVEIVAGTPWYDLHPSIQLIRGAARRSDGRPVDIINVEDMASKGMRFDGRAGPLQALVIGIEENRARAWPLPSADETVELTIFRGPLSELLDVDQPLEIESKHHTHLLSWVKHRAYMKEDAETFDKAKAAEHEARFLAYCSNVQDEQRRKRHKTRVVVYGGL